MKFAEDKLKGAFVITPELIEDERGFFARTFCCREFEEHGLNAHIVQGNVSFNRTKGTLRGMHYRTRHHAEVKIVRCTAGVIYDVIIDLRPESPTFKHWSSVELSADNRKLLYIPEGFAHGFQTLTDNTEVSYQHSAFHSPSHERGVRFNDPGLNIVWPLEVSVISPKDRIYPIIGHDFQGFDS